MPKLLGRRSEHRKPNLAAQPTAKLVWWLNMASLAEPKRHLLKRFEPKHAKNTLETHENL